MTQENLWLRNVEQNPAHSQWYINRFRAMAAQGADLDGEARLIDAMVPRGARILDAGCGPGRLGGYLAGRGHDVVGVDIDPALIDAAEDDHPGPNWLVGDLAELDLPARGVAEPFDAIVCAGNVMTFCAPSTRPAILRRFRAHLAERGRVVIGFGSGRGYDFDEFLVDAAKAGFNADVLLSTWDLRPFSPDDDFLVAVFSIA
ncbi:methyltransferase domain-containing protein [Kineosporia sp. J2-2]|uniref:Methyltransferase domain-containing protein n=1 Tax=Kineosporia corallincola TaxID=2835133 RepID=A0ABS5TCI8_9ACTN|nr:class I SAM-dependent methyltransferase [Kineosporia corallincola]MBT0768800.1 methyltransferase domain-containing protein [Kineosporia corallincola]